MIGNIRIKIEGLNSSKIINTLVEEGVLIKNLVSKSKYSVFDLDERDEIKLKQICKRYRKKYSVISKSNFVNCLKKVRYYIGFMLAMVIVFVTACWSNLYVYKINVQVDGDKNYDLEKINNLLSENGIDLGIKKKDVDIDNIQKLILSSEKDISACTVKRNGGSLDIIVYPGVLKEELSKDNIYSNYNAIITGVDIFAGKTNLKVGDLVRVGDLLIENDNGASGKITGKIYFSDYLIYNENQIIKEKTGREYTKTYISIFNKILGKSSKNAEFANYFEENCVFSVSNNTFIPVDIVKTKYIEFEYKESVVEFSKVENELKKNLYNQVLSLVPDSYNIGNVTYSIVSENNLTRLDCFIECEINLIA